MIAKSFSASLQQVYKNTHTHTHRHTHTHTHTHTHLYLTQTRLIRLPYNDDIISCRRVREGAGAEAGEGGRGKRVGGVDPVDEDEDQS